MKSTFAIALLGATVVARPRCHIIERNLTRWTDQAERRVERTEIRTNAFVDNYVAYFNSDDTNDARSDDIDATEMAEILLDETMNAIEDGDL